MFDLTVSFKFFKCNFQICLFCFLKYLQASRLILFRLSTLLWLVTSIHCVLPASFDLKSERSSSRHGSCSFNSYRPILYLVEVLIYLFMFFQTLFMSSSSRKNSTPSSLSVISISYRSLSCISFGSLKLNLPHQTPVLLVYLLPIFP